ncbi:MAG: type II secretion system GspH family protein, partial [Lentisphaeraceae bacterium]|nr:type II secretion system GspH family protein [Lentisphaeraceae bacterium]
MKKFTLIELLIVIAIIGILVSILLPSLNKARDVSKNAVCLSNVDQWDKAVAALSIDDNGKLITPLNDRFALYLMKWEDAQKLISTGVIPNRNRDTSANRPRLNTILQCPLAGSAGLGGVAGIARTGRAVDWDSNAYDIDNYMILSGIGANKFTSGINNSPLRLSDDRAPIFADTILTYGTWKNSHM